MEMPKVIVGDSLNSIYEDTVRAVLEEGEHVKVRDTASQELHPCLLKLTNPCNRTLIYPLRGNNPFTALFETVWVLAGQNDIEHLKFFLPRAGDFSDDQLTWRAGYGFRIFNYRKGAEDINDGNGINQFYEVFRRLVTQDEFSRSAIISLWDPVHDNKRMTKDYPCTNHLAFLVRDGKLDLTVTIRSNDVLWGMSSINVYEFTVMQEIMAGMLGIPVGNYYHFANSMHIYTRGYNADKNLPRLKKSVYWHNEAGEPISDPDNPWHPIPLNTGKHVMNALANVGVVPFKFHTVDNPTRPFITDNNNCTSTLRDYKRVYQVACRMTEAKVESELQSIYEENRTGFANQDIISYLYLYVYYQLICKLSKERDARLQAEAAQCFSIMYEDIMTELPLTDLQVSIEFWFLKKHKAIKAEDYQTAIHNCVQRKEKK